MQLNKTQMRLVWPHGIDRVADGTLFVVRCALRAQLRQPVSLGPISYHSRPAARLAAASNDGEATPRKPAVPVLPPRMHKRQPAAADTTDSSSKPDTSSSKGPPKRKRPRSSPQQPQFPGGGGPTPDYMQERALAGLLAYTGMMGTIATAISFVVPGLHLFGNFHLDTSDILLGLKLMAPVFLMNVLVMLPNYSSWLLPEPSAESKQKMAKALTKFQSSRTIRRRGGGGSSSNDAAVSGVITVSTNSESPAAQPAADILQHEAADCSPMTASSNSSSDVSQGSSSPQAASSSTTAAQASAAAKVSSSSSSTPGDVAPLWAQPSATSSSSSSSSQFIWLQDQISKSPALSRTKDALFLAQGHCLAQNPALILPPVVQVAVLLAECMAAQLLYRSVTLQLTGSWISDRLYEAGADDLLAAVTADFPVQPGTQVAGQLIALALLSSAWGVAVLQRVFSRRRPLVVGVVGLQGKENKEAADQLLQELRKSSKQQQQHSSRTDDTAASSSSNSSEGQQAEAVGRAVDMDQQGKLNSSSSGPGSQSEVQQPQTHVAASQQQPRQQKHQQVQDPPQQQQQKQQSDKRVDLQGQQWSRRTLPRTVSAMAWSHLICGVRDISQATALGLGFVLTGNLAAPVAAAVLNQLLFTVLQKHARERARKRSHAIANQLAGLARQLRDEQRKQLESKRRLEAAQQPQQQQQLSSAAAVTGLQAHLGDTPVLQAAGSHQEQVAADVLHGPDGAGGDAVGSAGSVLGSRMERTINVLDQLLGEQLDGHAAAGPGASGK